MDRHLDTSEDCGASRYFGEYCSDDDENVPAKQRLKARNTCLPEVIESDKVRDRILDELDATIAT
jgi:hypothetical protein